MKYWLSASLTAALLLGANEARAGTTKRGTIITGVYANTDSLLLIRLATGVDGEGCSDNAFAVIPAGNRSELFKAALASLTLQRPVEVELSGCQGAYAIVTSIGHYL